MRARAVSSGLGRVFLHPTPARRADGQLRPVLVPNLECAAFDHLVPVPVAKLVERLRLVSIDLESHTGDSTRLAALGALAYPPSALGHHRGQRRAVGSANGRNPIAVIVPCHRVISANGSLTGYGGGLERKQTLLELKKHRASVNLRGSS